MIYEFIIDASREDKDRVHEDLKDKIEKNNLTGSSRFYFSKSRSDAERFVRMSVFLLPKEEICFVACGDFTGQVAAGLVGAQDNKSMAILDYNITEDLLKSFKDRDFKDFQKMLDGEVFAVDMIKIGDDYSLNVCTLGLSATMAKISRQHAAIGLADENASKRAFVSTVLQSRFTRATVTADGKRLNGKFLLNLHVANGQWCGSKYHCAPDAVMDDGLLDIALFRPVPLFALKHCMKLFATGDYNSSAFARAHIVTCRAKHVQLDSSTLMMISYDGEITASRHFEIDVLPKAVKLILPKKS